MAEPDTIFGVHPRPARIWIFACFVIPIAIGWVFYHWFLFASPYAQILEIILSVSAAVAFLAGAWLSIQTRTELSKLEIIQTVDEAQHTIKMHIGNELHSKLLRWMWWEWRCYLVGIAFLFLMFTLSALRLMP